MRVAIVGKAPLSPRDISLALRRRQKPVKFEANCLSVSTEDSAQALGQFIFAQVFRVLWRPLNFPRRERNFVVYSTPLDGLHEFSSILFFCETSAAVTNLLRKAAQEGENERDTLCLLREYLPKPDGGICNEGLDAEGRTAGGVSY